MTDATFEVVLVLDRAGILQALGRPTGSVGLPARWSGTVFSALHPDDHETVRSCLADPAGVELDVDVPDGEELNGVQLYWNETRIATMYDPPFVQTVHIPSKDGIGYLRAVATLKEEGIDPSEDVVLVNAPDYMETVNVHLVELPTTVLRDRS